jgi:hypothetical protein
MDSAIIRGVQYMDDTAWQLGNSWHALPVGRGVYAEMLQQHHNILYRAAAVYAFDLLVRIADG